MVSYAQWCERWSNDQSGSARPFQLPRQPTLLWSCWHVVARPKPAVASPERHDRRACRPIQSLDSSVPCDPSFWPLSTPARLPWVVFSSGKPVTETWLANTTASIVQQFYPSEEGATLSPISLFGDYSPSGRLIVSFSPVIGDLPVYYNYPRSGRITDPGFIAPNGQLYFGHQYVLGNPQPWYEFGYGPPTPFDYSSPVLSQYNASVHGYHQGVRKRDQQRDGRLSRGRPVVCPGRYRVPSTCRSATSRL